MEETIYCPRCDKTAIKTTAGKPGGELGGASKVVLGTGGIRARAKLKQAAEYIPIYHHCENCGHTFLSLETNIEELRRARRNKGNGLFLAIFWGLVGVFLCAGGWDNGGMLLIGIIGIGLSVFGIINVVRSVKAISELEERMCELEQCQQRHKPLRY